MTSFVTKCVKQRRASKCTSVTDSTNQLPPAAGPRIQSVDWSSSSKRDLDVFFRRRSLITCRDLCTRSAHRSCGLLAARPPESCHRAACIIYDSLPSRRRIKYRKRRFARMLVRIALALPMQGTCLLSIKNSADRNKKFVLGKRLGEKRVIVEHV